jgi:hypothetical protein
MAFAIIYQNTVTNHLDAIFGSHIAVPSFMYFAGANTITAVSTDVAEEADAPGGSGGGLVSVTTAAALEAGFDLEVS